MEEFEEGDDFEEENIGEQEFTLIGKRRADHPIEFDYVDPKRFHY